MEIPALLGIEFGLALNGIIDAYHIQFMDFDEVRFLNNKLLAYLNKDKPKR